MAIIKCPECGHQVSDKAATCPSCGIEIAGKVVKCPECGTVVFKDQEMCPSCHHQLCEQKAPVISQPNPVTVTTTSALAGETERGVIDSQPQGKSRRKSTIGIIVAVVVVLVVAFTSAYFYKGSQQSSEADAYAGAMASDQPSVLQNYLDIYTDAPQEHRDSVQAHLELLMSIDREWADALVSGSKTAIERYLQMHPNSNHATEAKIKIDSLDYVTAVNANTPEAFQVYMDNHTDGLYYDEAKDMFNRLEAQKVSADDEETISSLFCSYFKALSEGDEDGLTANVANVMDSFLHKANATKNDLITYMHKMHEEAGQGPLEFRTNNDWKITKSESADGSGSEYVVTFSVDEKTSATADGSHPKIVTYKVEAKVSPDGKITTLNMKRMIQE